MLALMRKYLLAGLLFWVPIWVTLLLIRFLINLFDMVLALLPARYQPIHLFGFHIPGLGLIFTAIVLLLTGMVVTNYLGVHLIKLWDRLIARIPLVRSIYSAVKKTMETMFSSKGQAFRRVVLVEYPRKGLWSIAFQTASKTEVLNDSTQTDMMAVFVPTTPNPTSGFLIMVPKEQVRELDMSVDEALKMVISLGVIQPEIK